MWPKYAIYENLTCALCVKQLALLSYFVGASRRASEQMQTCSYPFLPPKPRAELLAKKASPSMITTHPSSIYMVPARYNNAPVVFLRTHPARPHFKIANRDDPQQTWIHKGEFCMLVTPGTKKISTERVTPNRYPWHQS